MRVVHVYKDIFPVKGGIENYILDLCTRLRTNHDIDAQILVTNTGRHTERLDLEGVPTVKAGRFASVASTPLSPMLTPLLRQMKPDLVHLHAPYPVGELSYLLATPNVPMVMTYHSDIVRQKKLARAYAPILELVLRSAKVIIATSPQYRATSPWLRRYRARTRIITLGINQSPFREPSAHAQQLAHDLRQRYGPRILHSHGVFRYYKGLKYLIDAMPLIPDAQLLLSGGGPEEEALRSQTCDLDLSGRIHFVGRVSDVDLPAYYHASDVYVLPAIARSEALGLSMIEAQASGKPSISTEVHSGTSYVNIDGVTGIVVEPMSAKALAAAATHLLNDSDLRLTLGQQAEKRSGEIFDIETITADMAALYREVLA